MLEDIAVGVATELVAAGVGLALAAAILFPGMAGVVELVAVELDGESLLGPAAVHAATAGRAVGFREREPFLAQQPKESLLELAEGDADVSAEDVAQLAGARGVGPSGEHGFDLRGRGAEADPGLVAGPREGIEGEAPLARSVRVRATVVTGIRRQVVASAGSTRRDRRVLTPGTRRSVRAVTSGGGAEPLRSPSRCAAARPLSSAPSPQARTAAM